MSTGIRVLIVADDPLVRAGLAAFLAQHPGAEVVAHVPAHSELAADIAVYRPDVVLWDAGQEPAAGLDRLAELSEGLPPIVALVPDTEHIRNARLSGARGVLFRDASASALVSALHSVSEGLLVYAADSVQNDDSPPEGQPDAPVGQLTPRELDVLRLLASGLPNKTIAQNLEISEHTVKFHVNSILGKLGATSRTDAVVRASRLGLVFL
ncbi:MAG: response regulator transcription factor [Chloroflexi bacterium]|nr:response regulator transcription factor [Chloroflexota bacterium]